MNLPENGVFPFAIQVILRKMVCRGECEVKKGRERKGKERLWVRVGWWGGRM